MIQGVKVINHESKAFDFLLNDTMNSGLYIQDIDGLGYPSSSVSTSSVFNYAISKYGNTEKQPRNIVITFGVSSNGYYTVEQARRFIYEMFPQDIQLYMEFKTDEVNYKITGYVENVTPTIFDSKESVQVSIICPNPYFYTGGKTIITSEDNGDNFQFTEWFEQLTKENGEYVEHKKAVSFAYADDEPKRWVEINSRIANPTGLEIKLHVNGGFNKFVLEDQNGKMTIDPNPIPFNQLIDESALEENFFKESDVVIVNDYNDQNVYEVQGTEKKSLLSSLVMEGDFVGINAGYNKIVGEVLGIVKEKTDKRYYRSDSGSGDSDDINGFNYNAWSVSLKSKSSFIEVDVYNSLSTDENGYLGHLTISPLDDLEEKENTDVTPPPDVVEGVSYPVDAFYQIPNTAYPFSMGIYMTRSKTKQNNLNEYEENGYYYSIWLKLVDRGKVSQINFKNPNAGDEQYYHNLKVDVKDLTKTDALFRMYYQLGGTASTRPSDVYANYYVALRFNYVYYVRTTNYLELESYLYSYKNITDFLITVSHDEMYDGF